MLPTGLGPKTAPSIDNTSLTLNCRPMCAKPSSVQSTKSSICCILYAQQIILACTNVFKHSRLSWNFLSCHVKTDYHPPLQTQTL